MLPSCYLTIDGRDGRWLVANIDEPSAQFHQTGVVDRPKSGLEDGDHGSARLLHAPGVDERESECNDAGAS